MAISDGAETLEVKVIADTQDFSKSVADIGQLLEKNLLTAVRKGSLGFDDLKRVAFNVMDEIASQALGSILASSGGKGGGGFLGGLGGIVGSILGLPGRATGGNVSPGRGYLVGERGPELFVPTSAGRVETGSSGSREVRVSINVTTPQGSSAPQALQRSTRQVASSVRRALTSS